MDTPQNYSFKDFLPAFLVLSLSGWIGLILVIFLTLPTLGPRWLFFFLGVLALSGSFIPVVYFLNKRFPSDPPVDKSVILREAILFGIYGAAIIWLQMGHVLNASLAFILAGAIILIELLLRMWERSHWKPKLPQI